MQAREYDAIIIGAGQGGVPFARDLAAAGRRTALVERVHVGGTCVNEGCTPTKTMVASARVAYLARRAADYGVHTGPVTVDMAEIRSRKERIVAEFRTSNERRLTDAGVDILMGTAAFTGPHALHVRLNDGDTLDLSAPLIVIDTGARPVDPPIPGLERVPRLNSTSIMDLDALPDHLVVLGGGYVGIEFGQMFRRFGSRVTIVQQAPRLMGREDADIAAAVAEILREDGIDVLLNATTERVEEGDGDSIHLSVRTPDGQRDISGSHLLVAAGRAPNTEDLDLDAAGVSCTARGFIAVNDKLETVVPGVYALGDVAGSPQFTHISYDDYRIVKANLLDGGKRDRTVRPVPYTMFMDPQLGRIGLTEEEARAQGRSIRVACIPMAWVARALEVGEPRGMIKAVVDAETDRILGASVLALEGGEIMAMIEIAMMGDLPYTVLRDGVFAHPTLAELLNTLFTSFTEG